LSTKSKLYSLKDYSVSTKSELDAVNVKCLFTISKLDSGKKNYANLNLSQSMTTACGLNLHVSTKSGLVSVSTNSVIVSVCTRSEHLIVCTKSELVSVSTKSELVSVSTKSELVLVRRP